MPKKNDSDPIVPTYFKSLEIENIRCFGAKQKLSLVRPDGTLAQWTLLLGENGIGKTTLLQCLAWMRPAGRYGKEGKIFGVAPALLEEENPRLESLVRSSKANRKVTAVMRANFVGNRFNEKERPDKGITKRTGIDIISKEGKLKDAKPNNNSKTFDSEIHLITYSARRKLGKQNLESPNLSDSVGSIFDESTELYDPEAILTTLDHASKDDNKGPSSKLIKKIKEMLVAILPELKSADDITILGPQIFKDLERYSRKGGVVFTTPYGIVPFDNLSLGYKTNIGWTVDLAWRLSLIYPKSNNPLIKPAIVLIDEIDLHLHPLWQRSIMKSLSEHFPRIQFIATSHSPFMIQAAYGSNYAVLNKSNKEVIINNTPKAVDGWRIDQIATSELIGVPTSRGELYEELYFERKMLLEKSKTSDEENKKLKKLDREIAKFPSGETPEEIEDRQFLKEVAEILKKDKNFSND